MAEYTPTTDEVREAFRAAVLHPDDLDLDDAPGQAFDRWLAAHDREVAAKAWGEGAEQGYDDCENGREEMRNPHREGGAS